VFEFGKVLGSNIFGFSYELNPSLYESSKVPYPTTLGLAMRWAQMRVGQVKRQTQLPWIQLRVKPKCMWVSQDARYNYLGFSYTLSPKAYESAKVLDLSPLDSKLNTYWVDNLFRFHVGSHGFICLFICLVI
jgi:hypothetical protein